MRLRDEDIKHKDTFNYERYNKDVVKEVDKHNKELAEYYKKKIDEELEYNARFVAKSIGKVSTFINWRDNQYEEIFGHS